MQAAVGLSQLDKLPGFIAPAQRQLRTSCEGLAACAEHLILPEATAGSDPSWFGLPITVRRRRPGPAGVIAGLEAAADRHPAAVRRQPPAPARLPGDPRARGGTPGRGPVMARHLSGWASIPGLTRPMLDHVATT